MNLESIQEKLFERKLDLIEYFKAAFDIYKEFLKNNKLLVFSTCLLLMLITSLDILNKYFRNDVIFLDPSWNVVNCGHEIYAGLPDAYVKALQKAEAAPKLIHYAGYEAKPWNNRVAKFSEYYFYYLRQSFWYEQVIFTFANEQGATVAIPQKSLLWRAARKCWQAMPYFMKRRLNRLKGYLQHKL